MVRQPGRPLNFTSSSESQNTYVYFPRADNAFSGGATLGAYGAAGLVQSDDVAYTAKQAGILPDDFVAYQNARATKSWFLLDDEIVVLAAGVAGERRRAAVTTRGQPHRRPRRRGRAHRRRAGPAAPWQTGDTAPPRWLRYANATRRTAVGYVFLDQAARRGRAGDGDPQPPSRTHVQPRHRVTKQVFAVSVAQPAGAPPASSRTPWCRTPPSSVARLRGRRLGPRQHHPAPGDPARGARAARRQRLRGRPAPRRPALIDGPASVLVQSGDRTVVALADPTIKRDRSR